MKKAIKVMPKKRRGRPATGKDPQVVLRMPTKLIADVDAWGTANNAIRSEAIRRLVEIGLKTKRESLNSMFDHRKDRPLIASPPWMPEEEASLRAMADEGQRPAAIAKRLGRTEQAVRHRFHKLGIPLQAGGP
jgi:hypothetical protein